MLFTSYGFFAFLAGLFLAYYLLPRRWQWGVLLAGSYFFYLFAGSFSANPLALLRSCCQNPTANSWSQKWAANGANFEAELEKIIALYTAN